MSSLPPDISGLAQAVHLKKIAMLVNSGVRAGDAQWARGSTDDAADLGVCWRREGIKMKSRQIQKICSRLSIITKYHLRESSALSLSVRLALCLAALLS